MFSIKAYDSIERWCLSGKHRHPDPEGFVFDPFLFSGSKVFELVCKRPSEALAFPTYNYRCLLMASITNENII